jgi:hypothetical protein
VPRHLQQPLIRNQMQAAIAPRSWHQLRGAGWRWRRRRCWNFPARASVPRRIGERYCAGCHDRETFLHCGVHPAEAPGGNLCRPFGPTYSGPDLPCGLVPEAVLKRRYTRVLCQTGRHRTRRPEVLSQEPSRFQRKNAPGVRKQPYHRSVLNRVESAMTVATFGSVDGRARSTIAHRYAS